MKKITLAFILLFSLITNAQLNVNNTTFSPADLILTKLIGPGVTVSNVKYNRNGATAPVTVPITPSVLTTNGQLGFYTTGTTPTNLGLVSGLLMTNGSASGAVGPNSTGSQTTPPQFEQFNDVDLFQITGRPINHICILEFDFIPQGPEIKFEYVFASEEYPEFVGTSFNDVFGFFLSGPGILGTFSNGAKNIALVPNTTTPISINNVNSGLNSAYYVSNGGSTIQYDGFTTVLTAKSEVQCGQIYHMKLAIADVQDNIYDSAVFLKEGSFSAPEIDLGAELVGPASACCGEKLNFSTPFNPTEYPGAEHNWYFNNVLVYTTTTSNTFEFNNTTCTNGVLKVVIKPYPSQNCTFEKSKTIEYQYGPVLNTPPPLTLCSDNPATATGSFDLNMQINNIIPNFDSDYEDLGFFNTREDAIANINPIPVGSWHNFTGVDNQSVFLGVINILLTNNICRSVMEFKLKFVNCDDTVCVPNPSSAVFDLTTRKPLIFNGFDPSKYSISFHHDMPAAVAGTAPITPENAYPLTTNPEEIYVRYWENAVPANKQFTQFTLLANQSNYAGADGNLSFCITDTAVFNLSDYITGEQSGGTWSVVSGSGANVDLVAGTITSNNVPANYVLEYKANASTNCPDDVSLLNVTIVAVCGAQTPPDLFLCDDSSNNGIEIFDLSLQNAAILGTLSSTDYTISYHVSSADAISGALPITPNTAYPNISNPQTIYIRVIKNADNSVFDTDKSFQIHVVPQPVVTSFTGTTAICLGSSTNLTFTGTPNATVTYSDGVTLPNPTVLLDATTGSATVSVSPTTTTTYSLVSITTLGPPVCTNSVIGNVLVTVNDPPTAVITYASPFCSNDATVQTVTFSGTGGAFAGGVFSSALGLTIDATTGAITPSTSTAGVYTVMYTIPASGGCAAIPVTTSVTISPIPTGITITTSPSPAIICVGGSANLEVTATPGTVITWSGTPSSFTIGSTGMNVIPVFPTATTTYTLTSASLNGCTIPVLGQSTTVTVSPTPQFITQVPDITICNGGTLNIASQLTSTVPGTTFVWSATSSNVNTAAISGNQGNIDQIVNLINSLQEGSFNIEVTPQVGTCSGTSQQILVNVKTIPVIPVNNGVSADRTVICNNESVTITLNSSPAATLYNWQVNAANTNGVQIVGGATSGTSTNGVITLQLSLTNPLAWGEISFNFTPENATCPGDMVVNAIKIRVNPIPGTPIGLPVSEICSGESTNLTISSFPIVTGTDLVWTVIDSQNVTGFTNGTGPSPFVINDLLINTSNVQGFVKYSVTSKLGNCTGGTTEYIVEVNPLPKPNLINGHICVNEDTGITYQGYVLDAQLSDPDFTYDWYILNPTTNTFEALLSGNQSTYEATVAGTYQLIVTNTVTNCAAPAVQATVGTIYPAQAFTSVVTDAFTNDATITVTVNPVGTGNLIYSLDGGAWQSSNVFTGVEAGLHQVMVEDVEGCTNLTQSVMVIDYPKFFTPNGDGYNDNWNIVGLNQADAKLYIFDRYGKLIKQLSATDKSPGWDGTYNGQQAPSSDYWFSLDYIENNQQKQFKSHFSLKR